MKKRTIQKRLMAAVYLLAMLGLSGCTSPLGKAAARGNTTEMKRLIQAGADINQKIMGINYSPLMYASQNGHIEAVKMLLDAGAEVELVDVDFPHYQTVIEIAQGHVEIVELLMNNTPQARKEQEANTAIDQMILRLETASLSQLLQKYDLDNEVVVSALTDALITAKVTQLPKFMLTASYDEISAMQVALEKRLVQSAVEHQKCNNQAQGFAEQDNTPKATEYRNLAAVIHSYQAVLNAIKTELESDE